MTDKEPVVAATPPQDIEITGIVTPIVKAEPEYDEDNKLLKTERDLVQSNALDVEDNDLFSAFSTTHGRGTNIVQPTYLPFQLSLLTQQNNTLLQCVTAMEVNIDGTGYEIRRKDGKPAVDSDTEKIKQIREFFDEPYPYTSFVDIRRKLRRSVETTGNGYLEVIRSVDGDIIFLKWLDDNLTRLVRHEDDSPTLVESTVKRMGKDVTAKLSVFERRYAQVVGKKLIYFKQFGSKRKLDKYSGLWEDNPRGGPVAVGDEGTEVLHFTANKDVLTNYGVPRWINNIPSVLGSRKAEELNLEFFNHGGMPPVMFVIQGGSLSQQARESLNTYLASPAQNKQRGVIVELFSTSGDLNSASTVKVHVERFGAERQQDAMFMKYDDSTAQHVRMAFRLPPLLVGLAEGFNFATAIVSYMVAESQVFSPEREEFDGVINLMIMSEIAPDYVFRSIPVSLVDIANRLKALELSKDMTDPLVWLKEMNNATHMGLTMDKDYKSPSNRPESMPKQKAFESNDRLRQKKIQPPKPSKKSEDDVGHFAFDIRDGEIVAANEAFIEDITQTWRAHVSGETPLSEDVVTAIQTLTAGLNPEIKKVFQTLAE